MIRRNIAPNFTETFLKKMKLTANMEAVVVNFRRSRHRQHPNQLIIQMNGVEGKEKAEKMVGKKVTYTSPAGKKISGQIRSAHGNSGALRVLFEKGLPGQALGRKVIVE